MRKKRHKTKRKISKNQIIRRLIQIAAFLLMPGLFISTFSAIKSIYTALIGGTFAFSTLSYDILLLVAVIPITVLMGRFFCGYICSFGAMADLFWYISQKIHKKRYTLNQHLDQILKKLKYLVLLFIVVFIWTLGFASFSSTANPWNIFGMFASIGSWPSVSYLFTIGGALMLLFIIGSIFIERFFCRYLCPLGAVFSLLSLARVFRIKKPRKNCGPCTLCTSKCSMGISLKKTDQINSGECINCFQCISVCPKQNAKANPTPTVATLMAATAITGLYYVGNLTATSLSASTISTTTAAITESMPTDTTSYEEISSSSESGNSADTTGAYTDGVYTGSGYGFRGTTNVSVTVSGGNITAIEVTSYQDDREYFVRAESSVISSIINTQSIDVSTVSGATFSSNALIEAVADALSLDFINPNSSMQKR